MDERTAKLIWKQERSFQQSEALKKAYQEGKVRTAFISGHEVKKEWKVGVRESNKANPKHTIPHSEETKLKISSSRKGKNSGESNPMWKGGISLSYKTGYYSPEYKEWRKLVFKRDSYTCQACGVRDVYITAHHIKSFSRYPELRFDLDNGLALCEPCHEQTDNYKGRGKRKTKLDTLTN